MVSLLDIAPADAKTVTVLVRGQDVGVRGVSVADIAFLIKRFPEVRDMFSGTDAHFTLDSILDRAPDMLSAIIACGTGNRTPEGIAAAESLSVEEQTDLLDGIFAETFKGGVGPFVDKVKKLLGGASAVGSRALASN